MKVWRLSYQDDDTPSGVVNRWFASKRKLQDELRTIKRDSETDLQIYAVETLDVPTTKTELIAFLEQHAGVG